MIVIKNTIYYIYLPELFDHYLYYLETIQRQGGRNQDSVKQLSSN